MKYSKMLVGLVLSVAVAGLVGCKQEADLTETYAGVPTDGKTCLEAYKLPSNQVKCSNTESRH